MLVEAVRASGISMLDLLPPALLIPLLLAQVVQGLLVIQVAVELVVILASRGLGPW